MNNKIIRITTVPSSLKVLLKGQLKFINNNGYEVVGISSAGKELNEVSNDEGIRTLELNMTRTISPFKDFISLIKMFIILVREKPDIVHTHTPKAGLIGMLASYIAGIQFRLHTVAGLPLLEKKGIKRNILNFVEKLTYKCSTKVYPNSFGLKDIILKNKFTETNKLKVIANGSSNGIDTSYFNPELFSIEENAVLKTNLGIKKTDFVFIFVGRIVSDKGINELVEAFDKICLVEENIKLLLVGPFEDELDPLQKKTKLLINNNDKIILVGYQNDVRPYFAISNTLVFPSYREGFPNVVMQAGAMKLPSIVSDINGCNEIIENNLNGIIIPVKKVKELFNAMIKIKRNEEHYNQFKRNCRSTIINRYDCKIIWNELFNEYEKLLDKK